MGNSRYEVIVVGAGTGGAVSAKFVSKLGLRTCLLDGKNTSQVGKKVCGDGIEEHHFDELQIPLPPQYVIQNRWKHFNIYSPDQQSVITLNHTGILVDRLKFGQQLLKEAVDTGLDFHDESLVLKPLVEHKVVTGVLVKDKKTGENYKIMGQIVIDASGFHSPLRKAMDSPYIEGKIDKSDYWVGYREILEVGGMDYDINDLHLFISQKQQFVGYAWVFPKGENLVNLGIVVQGSSAHKVKLCYEKYHKQKILAKLHHPVKVIHGGGGVVPVRRPLWSLVENGIMFVGDSACQVNCLHGGGIGSSMRAGIYSAEVAVKAIERGVWSIDGLWEYNKRYAKDQGGHFASLDLFRMPFSRFPDEAINYLLKLGVFTDQDLEALITGKDIQSDPLSFVSDMVGNIARPKLLSDLYVIYTKMNRIKQLYHSYPDRLNFFQWQQRITKIFKKVRQVTDIYSDKDVKKKLQKMIPSHSVLTDEHSD